MIKGFRSSQKRGDQKYATLQPLGAGKQGLEVLPKALSAVTLVDLVPEATSTTDTIALAGHSVLPNDIIRFTGGSLDYQEVTVQSVTVNEIKLFHKFDAAITPADTFIHLRAVTLTISKSGNLSTSGGPVEFILDGAAQQVREDTVTPSNNAPLPVKLTSATGDINITAGDLNVQTSHAGANYDSQRIGNGTNLWEINASLEGLVKDTDALVELQAILAKIIAAPATEAKQDTMITALGDILAKIIAAPATEAKQDAVIAELQAILAKIIAAPATEAKQDAEITELQAILAKIIAAPATEAKQDAEITELQAILAKIIAAPATEAKQDDIIAALGGISSKEAVLAGYFNASLAINNGSRTAALVTVPASKVATKLEIICKNGETFSAYDAAAAGNLIGRFTNGGSKLECNLAAGISVYLESDSPTFNASDLVINLIGVDA